MERREILHNATMAIGIVCDHWQRQQLWKWNIE